MYKKIPFRLKVFAWFWVISGIFGLVAGVSSPVNGEFSLIEVCVSLAFVAGSVGILFYREWARKIPLSVSPTEQRSSYKLSKV